MTVGIASSFSSLAAGSTVPAEEAENVRPRNRLRRGPLALSTCAGIGPWYDYRLNALVMVVALAARPSLDSRRSCSAVPSRE